MASESVYRDEQATRGQMEQGSGSMQGRRAGRVNVGEGERVVSAVLGGLLALWGLRRGGLSGGLAALAGSALAVRGTSSYCPVYDRMGRDDSARQIGQRRGWSSTASTRQSVTVDRPREEVYRFWRHFPNLARFMEHVERIDMQGDERSHWVVKAPAGQTVEWDAIVTEDRPNERIAWETAPGADVRSTGWVEFREAPEGRGTQITTLIVYEPPAGEIGRLVAKLFGEEPDVQAREDLQRLKSVLETGEVSSGQR